MRDQSPSPLATWLLAQAVPETNREALLGDLHEEYALRAGSASASTAARWYWGQACRSIPPLMWSSARNGRWLFTLAVAIGAYVLIGLLEFAVTKGIAVLLGPDRNVLTFVSVIVGLSTMVLGGYLAAWTGGRGAPRTLAAMLLIAVVVLTMTTSGGQPSWYGVAFLVGGPSAALAGGALFLRRRARNRLTQPEVKS